MPPAESARRAHIRQYCDLSTAAICASDGLTRSCAHSRSGSQTPTCCPSPDLAGSSGAGNDKTAEHTPPDGPDGGEGCPRHEATIVHHRHRITSRPVHRSLLRHLHWHRLALRRSSQPPPRDSPGAASVSSPGSGNRGKTPCAPSQGQKGSSSKRPPLGISAAKESRSAGIHVVGCGACSRTNTRSSGEKPRFIMKYH